MALYNLEMCLANCAPPVAVQMAISALQLSCSPQPCQPWQEQLEPFERGEREQLELVSLLDSKLPVTVPIN